MIYKEEKPVVFVPGMFGSLGKDIIPGTGNMDFGLAKEAYAPLMNVFMALGYKKEKNLFLAFYDWRKENTISAKKYLVPTINKAKEKCRSKKVDLVCHSMGGIVARAYVQSNFYNHDVDKLIMIGTPNSGTVKAYYFWSGGVLPYDKIEQNFFYRMLKTGFLFYFKKKLKEKWEIDVIRKLFPVAKELLPSFDYGDYLMYRNKSGFLSTVPIHQMKERNDFLNEINIRQYDYISKGIETYQIIGNGIETEDLLFVNQTSYKSKKWSSGIPLYSVKSLYGDGTVVSKSVVSNYSNNYCINGDHFEILSNSIGILSNVLGRKINHQYGNKGNRIFYSIIGNNISSIELKVNNDVIVVISDLNDNYKNIDKMIDWIKLNEDIYWLLIKKQENNNMSVNIKPITGQNSNIQLIKSKLTIQESDKVHLNYYVDDLLTLDL